MHTHSTLPRAATASPSALFLLAAVAALGAALLLALQIVLGLEYTEGGTPGTRWSMVAAMVTLALLPAFVAIARRFGAGVIAGALGLSFVAFLAYSLPATTGRTGEIKEAKASTADDVLQDKAELKSIALTLSVAKPSMLAECDGAPEVLPPNRWPECRRKRGTVTSLEERQAKLEARVASAGSAGAIGDLGSTLWAWALSWSGLTAAAIRKSSVLSFAIGLDFAIWSLVALGEHLLSLGFATRRLRNAAAAEAARQPLPSETAQTSFHVDDLAATRATVLGEETPRDALPFGRRNRGNPGNGGDRGDRPRQPTPGTGGGADAKWASGAPKQGGNRQAFEADVLCRLALGQTIESQDDLAAAHGVHKGVASKWLKDMRGRGLIPAAQRVGRCHRLVAAE